MSPTHTTEITNTTTGNTLNRLTKEKTTEKPLQTAKSHRKSLFNSWTTTCRKIGAPLLDGNRCFSSSKIGAFARRKSVSLLAGNLGLCSPKKNRRLSSIDPPFSYLILSDSSPFFFVEPVGKWGRCGIGKRGTETRNE